MPPQADPASEEAHNQLLTSLSITHITKHFRNPAWKPPQRRNKNVAQMITDSTRREASLLATQNNSGAATPQVSSTGISTPRPVAANEGNRGQGQMGQHNIAQAAQSLSTLVLERTAGICRAPVFRREGVAQLQRIRYRVCSQLAPCWEEALL